MSDKMHLGKKVPFRISSFPSVLLLWFLGMIVLFGIVMLDGGFARHPGFAVGLAALGMGTLFSVFINNVNKW